jgi:hypothetical protein
MYPNHDGAARQRAPALSTFLRFFCSRRGAAMARAMITAWCAAGSLLGGVLLWIGSEGYQEFKATREAVHRIEKYIAGAAEAGTAMRADIGELKEAAKDLTQRVNGIDVRLARQEGRPRQEGQP